MRTLTLDEISYVSGGWQSGSTPIPDVVIVWGKRVRTSDRPMGGGGSLFGGPPDQSERGASDDVPGPLEWWNSMSEAQRYKIIGGLLAIGTGLTAVALTMAGPVAVPAAILAVVAGTATTQQAVAVAMVAIGVLASTGGAISLIGDLS
jgi:hypothetical protein